MFAELQVLVPNDEQSQSPNVAMVHGKVVIVDCRPSRLVLGPGTKRLTLQTNRDESFITPFYYLLQDKIS